MPLDERHLAALRDAAPALTWLGRSPRTWADSVGASPVSASVPTSGHTRETLRSFCQDERNSVGACFIAVMAWGGMRISNGRRAWKHHTEWEPALDALRSSELSRETDYERLRSLRPKPMRGVGPAFFTKLLFFLRPRQDAFILDQWTAKSVQLLTGSAKPRICRNCVTDTNMGADYEWYCGVVEHLAERLALPPATVEERLFAGGPGPRSEWRAYVVGHWAAHRARR